VEQEGEAGAAEDDPEGTERSRETLVDIPAGDQRGDESRRDPRCQHEEGRGSEYRIATPDAIGSVRLAHRRG
jgi:hypothetical protein